jgi:hypothetical protein
VETIEKMGKLKGTKLKRDKKIRIKKMLLEATQSHELLANTFYGVELKQDKILFPITPFGFEF